MEFLHDYQDLVCTCANEVETWAAWLGIEPKDFSDPSTYENEKISLLDLGICSEEAAKQDLRDKHEASEKTNKGKKNWAAWIGTGNPISFLMIKKNLNLKKN